MFITHLVNDVTEIVVDALSAVRLRHFTFACNWQGVWFAFSALTLLVGRQEGHPACKKL